MLGLERGVAKFQQRKRKQNDKESKETEEERKRMKEMKVRVKESKKGKEMKVIYIEIYNRQKLYRGRREIRR